MRNPEGELDHGPLRPLFDRRLKLEFHGSRVTSDAGLLAYRELDDALGLTALAGGVVADSRTGRNGWHGIVGLLRQSVYGRLAGYEDVNDADRLGRDPAMRWIVGGKAVERGGASTSQMGRFETELLANNENLAALADLSGMWIDRVHDHDPPRRVVLDMDSSVSPTFGEQEGTAYNGHFGCTCYHPLFVFNQFGDLERCALRPGNVHSAHGWRDVLVPVVERYKERAIRLYFRGDAAFASPEIYDYLEAEGRTGRPSRIDAESRRVLQDLFYRRGRHLTAEQARKTLTAERGSAPSLSTIRRELARLQREWVESVQASANERSVDIGPEGGTQEAAAQPPAVGADPVTRAIEAVEKIVQTAEIGLGDQERARLLLAIYRELYEERGDTRAEEAAPSVRRTA